jgi:hypothetical protein
MEERIICSAIWYKDFLKPIHSVVNVDRGVVLCGHRHAHIIHQHVTLMGKSAIQMGENIQGFLTSKNRFVDRKEGMEIAIANNQLIGKSAYKKIGQNLYSEDIY